MQVIVADDDPVMRSLLQMKLEADGHRVILAEDGEQALEQVGRAEPDLLVLDIVMPGVNGLEVTKRLRERPETATLPIVLLTGCDSNTDIIAGWQSGADYYITKPFAMEQLRYFIKHMDRKPDPSADEATDSVLFSSRYGE
jgi:DNA-binding response OmpR family regulator